MKTKEDVIKAISNVNHPAINFSLLELGIVNDVEVIGDKAKVVFAFPFPNIPIAEMLINSISQPIKSLGLDFEYSIKNMTEEEKSKFIQMEAQAWKG